MCKKMVALLLSLVMVFALMPSMVVTAEATEPADVSEGQAVAQLDSLINAFVTPGIYYFTQDGETCTGSSANKAHGGCYNCKFVNVVNKPWFQAKVSRVPSNIDGHDTQHYFDNYTFTRGEACCGFATFAGWYIFSQKETDTVTFNRLYVNGDRAYQPSYEVFKNARPGDVLRFAYERNTDVGHSAIFISCDKDYVKVLDCNSNSSYPPDGRYPSGGINNPGLNAEIRVHHFKYTKYNWVTISRAENYDIERTQLPATTIKVTNVPSTGKPEITWDAVPGAYNYRVGRADSKDGYYNLLGTTTETSWVDDTAVAGTCYYYKVRVAAKDSQYNSEMSNSFARTCDLPMPTNVACSNVTSTGGITIQWDPVEGADYYQVFCSTSADGTYIRCGGASITATSYTDLDNTTVGTTYYYKIRAFMNDTEDEGSAYSEYAFATRKCAQPVLEVDTPNDAETGKPWLSWAAVDGAQRYRVGRTTSANGTYNFLEYAEGTAWTDTTAVPGETYYYKIRAAAENTAGNSAMSAYVKRICSLPMPTNVICNNTVSGAIQIQWDAVEGADYYQLFRSSSEDGAYTQHGDEIITETSYIDTDNDMPGAAYYYKVKALMTDKDATSAYSESASCAFGQARGEKVAGTITSFLDETGSVTVQLFKGSNNDPSYETTVKGNTVNYAIDGVELGTYTMKVSKLNHVTHEYEVTVSDEAVALDAKIHPKGDINGDGRVNITDVGLANSHAKKVSTLTDYRFACGNVNGDTRINITDVGLLNAHAKKTNLLW